MTADTPNAFNIEFLPCERGSIVKHCQVLPNNKAHLLKLVVSGEHVQTTFIA